MLQVIDQQTDTVAGRTRFRVVPDRPGHVDVCPGGRAVVGVVAAARHLDKLLQEQRRRDRSTAFAAGNVLQICDGALQPLAVALGQRHRPDLVTRAAGRALQRRTQGSIVGVQSCDVIAQANDAGARQGRQVDDVVDSQALCIDQRVGERQSTFGVGVEDFNGLAVRGHENIARTHGLRRHHVLTDGRNEMHFHML
eukprot:gene4965-gene5476